MANHRYWRAINLDPYAGGAIEITSFHLLSSATSVDIPATLTSNVAPATGAVADLQDADTSTGVTWATAMGLVLQWDFGGTPVSVDDIRLGAADDVKTFPLCAIIQWSDDNAAWFLGFDAVGISWPGARGHTVSDLKGYWSPEKASAGVGFYTSIDNTRRMAGGKYSNTLAEKSANSGVLQFEVTVNNVNALVGVSTGLFPYAQTIAFDPGSWILYAGSKSNNGTVSYPGPVPAVGSVVGVVVNFTAGTITFYIDGVSKGVAYSNLAGNTLFPTMGGDGSSIAAGNVLRTQNFMYPVAGASPWESGSFIRRNSVRGRSTPMVLGSVSSQGAAPTSAIVTSQNLKQDKDYTIGGSGWGTGRITGTVKEAGLPDLPVKRRVRLHRVTDGLLVREVWSAAGTGAYAFNNIDIATKFYVVSFDPYLNYNAVIKDAITPEAMP